MIKLKRKNRWSRRVVFTFLLPMALWLCSTAAHAEAEVLWIKDIATLVFRNSTTAYSGYDVTKSWSGTSVTNTGEYFPDWFTYRDKVQHVVFDSSFADVEVETTLRWFFGMYNLKDITGLEYLCTKNVKSMRYMFTNCASLTSLDLSNFDTSNVTGMGDMFYGCSGLTSLDLSNFDTSNVAGMHSMFYGCSGLASLDLTSFNTSNVTVMHSMFHGCRSLTSLDLTSFNTSKVNDMNYMFYGCSGLASLDLTSFNTSNVTGMESMFYGCSGLTSLDLTGFDTSRVTNMSNMFYGCNNLETIWCNGNWKTTAPSSVNSQDMFTECEKLVGGRGKTYSDTDIDITYANPKDGYFTATALPEEAQVVWCEDNATLYFTVGTYSPNGTYDGHDVTDLWEEADVTDTGLMYPGWYEDYHAKVQHVVFDAKFAAARPTSLYGWFKGMNNLKDITGLDYLDTSNVTNMGSMFSGCSGLTSLDLAGFNTSNVTDMGSMFYGCRSLTSLDLAGFNTSNVTNMGSMFYGCSGLASLDLTGFNTSNVTDMGSMFYGCTQLSMIKCHDDWKAVAPSSVISGKMFGNCYNLLGGSGIAYSSTSTNISYANPATGYFTTADAPIQRAVAIWSADNATLYFTVGSYITGGTYEGQTITTLWSGANLTETGNARPMWHDDIYNLVQHVVFDASFADVYPTSTCSWFEGMIYLADITGLEYLNTLKVTDMTSMFDRCHRLTSLDLTGFKTWNVTSMQSMFCDCWYLADITGLEYLNTLRVTDMRNMFYRCSGLASLDLTSFNTSNVTDMGYMFYGCSGLVSLDLTSFNTSNVTLMHSMFNGCTNLKTIYSNSNWKEVAPSSVISYNMFLDCTNLVGGGGKTYSASDIDITYAKPANGYFTQKSGVQAIWCADNATLYFTKDAETTGGIYDGHTIKALWAGTDVTNTHFIMNGGQGWEECAVEHVVIDASFASVQPRSTAGWFTSISIKDITGLEYLNTSKVVDMQYMFAGCSNLTSLDLTGFNTSNVTNMSYMFSGCSALTSLDVTSFNTSNVTNMRDMFNGCSSLTSLDVTGFNTSNVTDMDEMFFNCSSLASLNVSGFNISKLTHMYDVFGWCSNLTSIYCDNDWLETSPLSEDTSGGIFSGCEKLGGETGVNYKDNTPISPANEIYYANPRRYFTLTEKTIAANAVGDEYWATYYHSYSTSIADENTTVYAAELNAEGDRIDLHVINDRIIPKGQAVVLKSTNGSILLSRISEDGSGDFSTNSLQGMDTETAVPAVSGTLCTLGVKNGNLGFYRYLGTKLGANKAYLVVPGSLNANVRIWIDAETPTGIETMHNDESKMQNGDAVYDLQGRRVVGDKALPKGLYIVNGKKVYN